MVAFKRIVSEGTERPRGYGVAYHRFQTMQVVCYPLGIHWLVGVGRHLWFSFVAGWWLHGGGAEYALFQMLTRISETDPLVRIVEDRIGAEYQDYYNQVAAANIRLMMEKDDLQDRIEQQNRYIERLETADEEH